MIGKQSVRGVSIFSYLAAELVENVDPALILNIDPVVAFVPDVLVKDCDCITLSLFLIVYVFIERNV